MTEPPRPMKLYSFKDLLDLIPLKATALRERLRTMGYRTGGAKLIFSEEQVNEIIERIVVKHDPPVAPPRWQGTAGPSPRQLSAKLRKQLAPSPKKLSAQARKLLAKDKR